MEYEEAVTIIKRVVDEETDQLDDREPVRIESLLKLGAAYGANRQFEDVIRTVLKVVEVEDEFPGFLETRHLLAAKSDLAIAYMAIGEADKGREMRVQATSIFMQLNPL